MKLLLAGAPSNATDGFIWSGVKRLVRDALPGVEIVTTTIPNESPLRDPVPIADGLVLVGSPWMWRGDVSSPKYKNLEKIIKLCNGVPKIALGLGSCFNLDDMPPSGYKAGSVWGSFDAVTVRDSLAGYLLPTATQLPCPAYYGGLVKPRGDDFNLLIYADPAHTISHSYWRSDASRLARTRNDAMEWVKVNKAHVAVTIKTATKDIKELQELNYNGFIHILKNQVEAAQLYSRAADIMSFRVHGAVPAAAAGKRVSLVPLDSRALTLQSLTPREILEKKQGYIDLIRSIFVEASFDE